MVTLLLARTSFVHGHAVLSADILLNCLLRLWCLQRGIHSYGNKSAFHGATSFSDTKRDLKRHLKKKTVPGVLWTNITPPFCVYKAPLSPLIVNRIIPQTSSSTTYIIKVPDLVKPKITVSPNSAMISAWSDRNLYERQVEVMTIRSNGCGTERNSLRAPIALPDTQFQSPQWESVQNFSIWHETIYLTKRNNTENGKLLRTNQCSFRDTHDRVHFSQKCCGILSPGGPRSGIYTVTHVARCTILSFQLSLLS